MASLLLSVCLRSCCAHAGHAHVPASFTLFHCAFCVILSLDQSPVYCVQHFVSINLITMPVTVNQDVLDFLAKPEHRDHFGQISFPGATTFSVTCIPCCHTFYDPRVGHLKVHVGSDSHTNYSSVSAEPELSCQKVYERNDLLNKYEFLRYVSGTVVECVYCEDKFDISANHKKVKVHGKLAKHDRKKRIHLEGTGQVKEDKRLAIMQQIVAEYPDKISITTQEDVDQQYCAKANLLYCKQCRRSFSPVHLDNYSSTVKDHFQSDHHKEAVKEEEKRKTRKEKVANLTPNSRKRKMEFDSDGKRRLFSPVQGKIVPRTITDSETKRAAKALAQARGSLNSGGTYLQDVVVMRAGRPVSASTITKRGYPNLVEGTLFSFLKASFNISFIICRRHGSKAGNSKRQRHVVDGRRKQRQGDNQQQQEYHQHHTGHT